jgi:hypothetical protein
MLYLLVNLDKIFAILAKIRQGDLQLCNHKHCTCASGGLTTVSVRKCLCSVRNVDQLQIISPEDASQPGESTVVKN